MDNLETQTDNSQAQVESTGAVASPSLPQATMAVGEQTSSWKSGFKPDLKNSPLMQKFEDTPDGLSKMAESYGNLEKLLGHEKVPIPKGPEDLEGWNRFSKAMGIPDKAANYGLPDSALPQELKGSLIDKERFAEIVHAHKLTPSQANGLWKVYNEISLEQFNKSTQDYQKNVTDMVSRLKSEWGDTYDTNIELGQMVINKFSDGQDMNDYITAVLSQDPRGIKFLSKIGDQFAENKVGEFQMKRFSLAPEEAQSEIDKMTNDLNGPYMNQGGKFTEREHQVAIDRVNALWALINKSRG